MAVVTLANGSKLSPRVLALVEDAAKACGLPGVTITKGSFVPRDALSGDTHAGDGAGDIRVWNIPQSKIVPLVVELRRRNCAAWYRDQQHGGFSPHIHFIVKDQPGLSPGARWQVSEYDSVRDGLSDRKSDYHPRPTQTPFRVTKWTAVTRWPRTGVYAAPDPSSTRRAWRVFGSPIPYVDVVTGVDGKPWLRNAAGNYVSVSATAYKGNR